MQSITFFNTQIQAFFLLIIGLIVGSFISLVSHRLITKEAIILGRSKCPSCHNKLLIRSLFPLISWLIQRGKCIFCQAKISYRYPLIELFSALGFVVTFIFLDKKIDVKLLIYLAIYTTMFLMVIVDLEHYFIPEYFTIYFGLYGCNFGYKQWRIIFDHSWRQASLGLCWNWLNNLDIFLLFCGH